MTSANDETFIIKSNEGSRWLELSAPLPPGDPTDPEAPPLEYFVATLALEGLQASLRIYGWGSESLVTSLEEMARDWRGWEGEKDWQSVEGDLALRATHDRLGQVCVTVALRSYDAPVWRAEGDLAVDPGSLDQLAAGARRFFRLDPGAH